VVGLLSFTRVPKWCVDVTTARFEAAVAAVNMPPGDSLPRGMDHHSMTTLGGSRRTRPGTTLKTATTTTTTPAASRSCAASTTVGAHHAGQCCAAAARVSRLECDHDECAHAQIKRCLSQMACTRTHAVETPATYLSLNRTSKSIRYTVAGSIMTMVANAAGNVVSPVNALDTRR
jgi:hypothetical protein